MLMIVDDDDAFDCPLTPQTSSTIPDALSDADVTEMEKVQTLVYPMGQSSFYMYTRVRWNLTIRKEVSVCVCV